MLPRKLAIKANAGALRIIEQKKKEIERKERQLKEESIAFVEKLKTISVTISVETGEDDKLYGSVTSEMICDTLKQEGIEIDKRKVVLDNPIKALGIYDVDVKLHPEVKASIRVWVVKK
ncbi:50S ribosomal protein L9 [Candidatus Omnitrophus magneticus]|uniref:50S ribosomal protein L9 n=1 Tax=Candidatus Omnitrophus magneticus TaxID=1609969 RepID=A0A0F0CKB2_9BACT|nr:50S ribosomal protein L9 [Candidatus Omnitrophus magneticus]